MSVDRTLRLNEMIRRTIGEALPHVIGETELDLSAITITRVIVSGDLRTARVMVSIREHVEERSRMLNRLRRHRADIQEVVARHVVMKYTPRLLFQLDTSVEKGDHVLHLLEELGPLDAGAPETDGGAPDDLPPAEEEPTP